jgi:hypothetical protein
MQSLDKYTKWVKGRQTFFAKFIRQFLGTETKNGRWPGRTTRKKNKGERVSCMNGTVETNNNLPLSTFVDLPSSTIREKMDALSTYDKVIDICEYLIMKTYGKCDHAVDVWEPTCAKMVNQFVRDWFKNTLFQNKALNKICQWDMTGPTWNTPFKYSWEDGFMDQI